MAQNPAQPILDWRDKLKSVADKYFSEKPAPQKRTRADGKMPTAKELGWADQSGMRKAGVDTKPATTKPAPKTAAKKYAKRGGK